jgi:protein phosphatase/serine/threonine-protein phosphatase Stp1
MTDDPARSFVSSAATHPGAVRPRNQDACLDRPDLGLWVVADGAGGHREGEAASRAIVAALDAIPAGLNGAELLAQVRLRLAGVHSALRAEAARLGGDVAIASTVVALIARGGHFACLWAGDSRAYRAQGAALEALTRDHSVVQEMVDAGALAAEAAEAHPLANVITRAVGADADELALDKVTGRLLPGDRFLLCSDGVWKTLTPGDLLGLLDSDAGAQPVLSAALRRAARDNVTAVTVSFAMAEDAGAPPRASPVPEPPCIG